MRALEITGVDRPPSLVLLAREPESPWAAWGFAEEVPPATLEEARDRRADLARLLAREHAACADFLLALADFDRRRGWERLGHASLFAFLTRELGLSAGAAQLRLSAARLLPRHPAVEAALRDGRLCISAVGQLARVLTTENETEVLPRFFGRSAREAMEVAAAILPREAPPLRAVVTAAAKLAPTVVAMPLAGAAPSVLPVTQAVASPAAGALHTYEVAAPSPAPPRTPTVEPLTADLRRLHLTVSKGFLEKVAAARTGLSHSLPGATAEQVLEAALDLLLEKQARSKALVRRPRSAPPEPKVVEAAAPLRATQARPYLPAAIEREIRLRDGDRCQYELDGGGCCGSTWRIELDHVIPVTLGGATSATNLRCLCGAHHRRESERELGPRSRVRPPRGRG